MVFFLLTSFLSAGALIGLSGTPPPLRGATQNEVVMRGAEEHILTLVILIQKCT